MGEFLCASSGTKKTRVSMLPRREYAYQIQKNNLLHVTRYSKTCIKDKNVLIKEDLMLKRSLISSGVLHFLISSATCVTYTMPLKTFLEETNRFSLSSADSSWFHAKLESIEHVTCRIAHEKSVHVIA